MVEYFPWSKKALAVSLNKYKEKIFSIVDLELGGDCNFKCIYCDSPNRSIKLNFDIQILHRFFREKYFKWIFVCGIGEPLSGKNHQLFIT